MQRRGQVGENIKNGKMIVRGDQCVRSLRGDQSDDDAKSVSSGANEPEPIQESLLFCPIERLSLRGPRPVFRLGRMHERIDVTIHVRDEQSAEKKQVHPSAIHRAIDDAHMP